MSASAESTGEEQPSTQEKRKSAWKGEWSPAESQGFRVTENFELTFSNDFPLTYLRGTHYELHLQEGEDGFIGAEAIVDKRHLIFLIFNDDEDPTAGSLVIQRIDNIERKRTEKILLKAYFRRSGKAAPSRGKNP